MHSNAVASPSAHLLPFIMQYFAKTSARLAAMDGVDLVAALTCVLEHPGVKPPAEWMAAWTAALMALVRLGAFLTGIDVILGGSFSTTCSQCCAVAIQPVVALLLSLSCWVILT